MTPPQPPSPTDLPSASRLLRSTLTALLVAVGLLVVIVLPAEYGIDPTGLGRPLGLTQMGEIKTALAREVAADEAADAAALDEAEAAIETMEATTPSAPADSAWRDVTVVPLGPGEGKELKLIMAQGMTAEFLWDVEGGVVNHDTHGDSTGAPKSYVGYRKGTGVRADSGALTALMDGAHGWYWRNRGTAPVTVTLWTRGDYAALKKRY